MDDSIFIFLSFGTLVVHIGSGMAAQQIIFVKHVKTVFIQVLSYGTAKKKRPGYLVGNLVATNWPIEKALHAIGYNQIPTK